MSEPSTITLAVDGVEVQATEGAMLVDAAKGGDVEIPVFCYEPKLGGPVGACRMCLVEIEGIPKLQTACSTPVRDGMVVYTRTDRVAEAQNAVVEFLLVNHPLDCPVCDKGGECPLQDIAMGWGAGRSRFTDPKRHFRKPVPLSPLVRIDRERCILCYRCVRFSQDVAEDEQLQLLERSSASYVGTFDERPYIAPFHGNIIELCPVGALTSEAYRFRARPWDIEDSGSVCTLCPSQCNVKFTVRDERIQRVLARDNDEVDGGWLCDKGRFGFDMISSGDRITAPQLGGNAVDWDTALDAVAERLRAAGPKTAAIVGGQSSNEEGYLVQRIIRGLGSANVTTDATEIERELVAALSAPEIAASLSDLDAAESVLVLGTDPLHAMPILDLRLRRAIRNGTRVVIASERPTALDGGAEETARYAPGDAAGFIAALAGEVGDNSAPEGAHRAAAERIGGELRPGKTVIVYGERIGDSALRALLELGTHLRCGGGAAGLIGIPDSANARGLREVGCTPDSAPGFVATDGRGAGAIREALEANELDAILLVNADPIRDLAKGGAWAQTLQKARTVISISMFENASAAASAIVLPAESYAEKEGTVTHPDGRLQRLRPAVPRPGEVRPMWQVLAELAARLDDETGIDSAPEALTAIAADVPFYANLTPEEITATGLRWQERQEATKGPWTSTPKPPPGPNDLLGRAEPSEATPPPQAAAPAGGSPDTHHRPGHDGQDVADNAAPGDGSGDAPSGAAAPLKLGTYRDLWSSEVTDRNEALKFLAPSQRLELAASDAERLGLSQGDEVEVRSNGHSVRAHAVIRERMRPGAAFLIEGTADNNANRLNGAEAVEVVQVSGPGTPAGAAEEVAGR